MSMLMTVRLSDLEKLETLNRLDQFRKWRSLDDKRYCLCCGKIIDGQGVKIIGGSRGAGPLRAICATEQCEAIPMDWILPTDEVLSKMSILPEQGNGAVAPAKPSAPHKVSLGARLRGFAVYLKRPE
jgi:hypothetical protein